MNIYFVCVIVYAQMWCVCAQPYVDQTRKIFCSVCLFLEVICITHVFSKFFKLFLCEKLVLWVFFLSCFMYKLNWELNGQILKFFSFGQRVSRLFHDYFVSKICLQKFFASKAFSRKFPNQLFKGHFMGHLF